MKKLFRPKSISHLNIRPHACLKFWKKAPDKNVCSKFCRPKNFPAENFSTEMFFGRNIVWYSYQYAWVDEYTIQRLCGQIFGQVFDQGFFEQILCTVLLGQRIQCTISTGIENTLYSSSGSEYDLRTTYKKKLRTVLTPWTVIKTLISSVSDLDFWF